MKTSDVEAIINMCWRISHDIAPVDWPDEKQSAIRIEVQDFIDGLTKELPDFMFQWDGVNRILVRRISGWEDC